MCWVNAAWLPSGSLVPTNSPHSGPGLRYSLCSSTALSGLECSFLSPLASVAIPLPSISLPPFSSDESLPSSEVSVWVWSVHANILFMLNIISILLKYRKSPFFSSVFCLFHLSPEAMSIA